MATKINRKSSYQNIVGLSFEKVITIFVAMMDIKNVSKQLGEVLLAKSAAYHANHAEFTDLKEVMIKSFQRNGWFSELNIVHALEQWGHALTEDNLNRWLAPYNDLIPVETPKRIGVINAGNIPFVGLHDLLSVLLSGHLYVGKNATDDPFLLPWIAKLLIDIEPELQNRIEFVMKLENIDAVIATGSNNSSRYFEYYFGKYPHIIRKNRNGVAILTGFETKEELGALGKDIFRYFGLGCRNVSKLYVPKNYVFDPFFEGIYNENPIMNHTKYMNNFDYNNSVLLLKLVPFLQNGFLIIREEEAIPSPISIVHYERYDDVEQLQQKLASQTDALQCIACNESYFKLNPELKKITVNFGQTQSPQLWDYADGVDTVEFLAGV